MASHHPGLCSSENHFPHSHERLHGSQPSPVGCLGAGGNRDSRASAAAAGAHCSSPISTARNSQSTGPTQSNSARPVLPATTAWPGQKVTPSTASNARKAATIPTRRVIEVSPARAYDCARQQAPAHDDHPAKDRRHKAWSPRHCTPRRAPKRTRLSAAAIGNHPRAGAETREVAEHRWQRQFAGRRPLETCVLNRTRQHGAGRASRPSR